MNDAQLFSNIISVIEQGLTARGITGVSVQQDYQTSLQGAVSGPAIYLHRVGPNRPYGWLERKNKWDAVNKVNVHTETQLVITTIQINAKVQLDPTLVNFDPAQMTASDYVNAARSILNSDFARWTLRQNGIAVERITEGRAIYAKDEKERFEQDPSYDCNFEHEEVTISNTPSTPNIVPNVHVVN